MKKLRFQSGETITEVLVASLVVVLGVLLFATMVLSSFHIVNDSELKMQEFYGSESDINEMKNTNTTNANVIFAYSGVDIANFVKENDSNNCAVKVSKSGDVSLYRK